MNNMLYKYFKTFSNKNINSNILLIIKTIIINLKNGTIEEYCF